jgi:hypothetical protein
MSKTPLALVPVLALVSFGCTPNNQGNIEATIEGDVSNPQAVVGDPTSELSSACGALEQDPRTSRQLTRLPYLNRVTPKGATVMWAGVAMRGTQLQITTPAGKVVKTTQAKVDLPSEGAATDRMLARVEGLKPGTTYCYSILDAKGGTLLGRVGFKTAPRLGADVPVSFAVLGDSGDATADQVALADRINDYPFDLMLHVGDMAYGSGAFAEFDATYFDIYGTLLSYVPVFPVAGNHEYRSPDAAPFRALFDLPNNERWYSFDYGDVHFIGLDTEQLGDEQDAWLERDLRSSNAAWDIVYLHKGPYSSGVHGSNGEVQDRFQPLFERYGVRLVFSGHDHHYERTKEINGVSYIVSGGGGAGTYPVQPSEFTALAVEVIEFVYVTIEQDTLSLHAIDGTGKEFDQLVIEQ